jgi:rSAM/selenodomain-associated transferase 1
MRPVLIVFAKAPLPGGVKTRLVPPLTYEAAARLHIAFAAATLDLLQQLRGIADIELHTDIPTDAWADRGVPQRLQCEGDLGLKLFQALAGALMEGRPFAMIIGSDSPTLPLAHLRELMESDADVAVGPTDDGGFYAICCRKVDPSMFDGVEWSSPSTLRQTLQAAAKCGLSVKTGSWWYDIDTAADLDRLANIIGMSADKVLKEGDRAPEIRLQDDAGNAFELSKLHGKNVVLYFYPKADTSGCTLESKEFSASAAEFAKQDAVIVGVSPDKIEAQCKFKAKYEFPFQLLADVDHYAADAYGVWTEKSMYGRKYMGIERSTFLIGKDGRIKKVFSKVKPAGHAAEVLQALTSDE